MFVMPGTDGIFSAVVERSELNSVWPSGHARIIFLLMTFGVVFLFEFAFPLFRYSEARLKHSTRNLALTALYLAINFALSPISRYAVKIADEAKFGTSYCLGLSPLGQLLLGIAGLDLFQYLAHVTLHQWKWLWRVHRVHHCDTEVDVTTTFRQHPGETLWRIGWHLAGMLTFGIPLWVMAIYQTVSPFNAQLRHANISLPPGPDNFLRLAFVTSNMHKVHHSRRKPESNLNFSNLLSVWDRLGGTYSSGPQFEKLRYGLDSVDEEHKQSLCGLLQMPFLNSSAQPRTAVGASVIGDS
jgi:sterol desaturase/sphingolipid hydroxylase (fatty acid hydroxylase superfamily)